MTTNNDLIACTPSTSSAYLEEVKSLANVTTYSHYSGSSTNTTEQNLQTSAENIEDLNSIDYEQLLNNSTTIVAEDYLQHNQQQSNACYENTTNYYNSQPQIQNPLAVNTDGNNENNARLVEDNQQQHCLLQQASTMRDYNQVNFNKKYK